MSDLINREELISDMMDTKENVMRMFQFPKNQINVAEAVADAMLYNVRRASAVDAVPVTHGHWVAERAYFCNDYDSEIVEYKCSECASYVLYEEYLPNYCPNCGVRMG